MKSLLFCTMMAIAIGTTGQTKIAVSPTLAYQNDSIVKNQIIPSLSTYLFQADSDPGLNLFISDENKLHTILLTEELKDMQKSTRFKNDYFYKPTILNVVPQNDKSYFIQLAYIGTKDSTTILVGSFDLIAKKSENTMFVFSSPLVNRTSLWKSKKIGIAVFHYKYELNEEKANEYIKLVAEFDKKLNNINQTIDYYVCNEASEVLNLAGVHYKSQYNGLSSITLSANDANHSIYMSNNGGDFFNSFDPHDLWHDRLAQHIARSQVNKSIDEGCAYLYGGSWGMTWKQILSDFKTKVCNDSQKDWLHVYGKYQNFGVSMEQHLYPEYVINALLVQKIEKERGCSAVLEFLKNGKNDPTDTTQANYFAALEKLTGIRKDNFSNEIWKLITEEK